MEPNMGSIAFRLTEASREMLLKRFPPKFEVVRCDHVTHIFGVDATAELPPAPASVLVVGYASDAAGVECLVVEVNGSSERPDGSTYHITHSRGEGRQSVESNAVIKEHGWHRFDCFIPIETEVCYSE
jgi:hypothetical protein